MKIVSVREGQELSASGGIDIVDVREPEEFFPAMFLGRGSCHSGSFVRT